MGGDVVLQSNPVERERETVTDLVMEVNMMATLAARAILSVGVIIANSSATITTRKMTVV